MYVRWVLAVLLGLVPSGPAWGSPERDDDMAAQPAAVTPAEQQRVAGYWTPERMRTAEPMERLLERRSRGSGTVARGRPVTVPATAPQRRAGGESFPNDGEPWPGDGAVVRTAGRAFFTYQGRTATCSANAVTSENRSTVITAGHCVKLDGAWHANWVFVPGYRAGQQPYGTWTARTIMAPPQWVDSEDVNYDFGAAVLNPLDGDALTEVVGGQGIAFNQPREQPMYAFGYPAEDPYDGSVLVYCSGDTFNDLFTDDIGMTCDMTGGASGGPWFLWFSETAGTGILNSVNSFKYTVAPKWMFGPYFGSEAQAFYEAAQAEPAT